MDFKDLLFFDKMFVPKAITFIYWLMLVGCVIGGLVTMFSSFLYGLGILIGGLIGARFWAEMVIVIFKINESLAVIRDK